MGNYANFLCDRINDYDEAETYYKKAQEIEPEHAHNLGNYGGFLLGRGKYDEGLTVVNKAITQAKDEVTLLECQFYVYAHAKNDAARAKSLSIIKAILLSGCRSKGWSVRNNINRAIEDGHKNINLLKAIADVIVDKQQLAIPDKFEEWNQIK